jgi:hypothetical protein
MKLAQPIRPCLESIRDKLVLGHQGPINDMINEFEYAEHHLKVLARVESECVPDEELKLNDACFDAITEREAELIKKAEALNLLKQKMVEPQQNLISLRNFAIEKFQTQKCEHAVDSSVTECFQKTDYSISTEALVLSGDALKIIVVQDQKTSNTDISELCEDEEVKLPSKDRLCALLNDQTPNYISKVNADSFRQSTMPDDGHDPFRAAVGDSLSKLFNQGLNMLMTPSRPNMFPSSVSAPYLPSYTEHAGLAGRSLGYGYYPASPPASVYGRSSQYFSK